MRASSKVSNETLKKLNSKFCGFCKKKKKKNESWGYHFSQNCLQSKTAKTKKFVVELNKSFSVKEIHSILEDLFLLDLVSVVEFKEINAIDYVLKKHFVFAKKIKSKDNMSLIDDIFFDLFKKHLNENYD